MPGYCHLFDSGALPRALGLDVIVQPRAIGAVGFGTSVRASTETPPRPEHSASRGLKPARLRNRKRLARAAGRSRWRCSPCRESRRGSKIFDQGRITVGVDPVEPLEIDLTTAADRQRIRTRLAIVATTRIRSLRATSIAVPAGTGAQRRRRYRAAPANSLSAASPRLQGDVHGKRTVWRPSRKAEFVTDTKAAVVRRAGETTSVQVQLIPEAN